MFRLMIHMIHCTPLVSNRCTHYYLEFWLLDPAARIQVAPEDDEGRHTQERIQNQHRTLIKCC